jgi:hypothetical protein
MKIQKNSCFSKFSVLYKILILVIIIIIIIILVNFYKVFAPFTSLLYFF